MGQRMKKEETDRQMLWARPGKELMMKKESHTRPEEGESIMLIQQRVSMIDSWLNTLVMSTGVLRPESDPPDP